MEKQIERMRKLSAMLQAASKAYYQEDKEIMSNLSMTGYTMNWLHWKRRPGLCCPEARR